MVEDNKHTLHTGISPISSLGGYVRNLLPRSVAGIVSAATLRAWIPSVGGGHGTGPVAHLGRLRHRLAASPRELVGTHGPAVGYRGMVEQIHDSQTTSPDYFVGVIPTAHETAVDRLKDSPFGVSYVSYPKHLADEQIDATASSSWVYRSWAFSHFQLHIVLFEVGINDDDLVYVFCHHEANWLRHPIRHLARAYLNPTWGRSLTVELLEAEGLPVYTCADIDDDSYDRAPDYCAQRGDGS